MTGNPQLSTELFDKMMDRLHCPAGTSDATRAEDVSMIVGIQDATPEQTMYILLEFQQLTKPLRTTANGQNLTVEVEVVRVRDDPMTPLPRHNSDESSEENSDNTQGDDE